MFKLLAASIADNKPSYSKVISTLRSLANPDKAKILQRFFKTAPGEYGAGDKFWGITVPQQREVAKRYRFLSLRETIKVLRHPVHECRLTALLILVDKYSRGSEVEKGTIVKLYRQNMSWINNWDLVDLSAPRIIGDYYSRHDRHQLDCLVASTNLWQRRVVVLSCLPLIKQGRFKEIFALTDRLLTDREDLMHKALGWMLREVGKVDLAALKSFLLPRKLKLPRTMLRYAIERFPEKNRLQYLKK